MKVKGFEKNGKLIAAIFSMLFIAVVAVIIFAVNMANGNLKFANENTANNPKEELLLEPVSIYTPSGDGTVYGETIIGGDEDANPAYSDGPYRNGYCLYQGAPLVGTFNSGHYLDHDGSAYNNTVVASGKSIGSIRWLLDNMIRLNISKNIPSDQVVSDDEYNFYKNNLYNIVKTNRNCSLSEAIGYVDELSDVELFQVQQYVIWYFTNNFTQIPYNQDINEHQKALVYVYHALKTEAANHSNYSSDGTGKASLANCRNYEMKQEGNDTVIGPLTVENPSGKPYKFKLDNFKLVNNSTGAQYTNARIYKADGTQITNDWFLTGSENIYIRVTCDITNGSFTASGDIYTTAYNTTAFHWKNGNLQPVVTLDRSLNNDAIYITKSVEKIPGSFNLMIEKYDNNGNTVDLGKNIFNVKRSVDSNNLGNAQILGDSKFRVHFNNLEIGKFTEETITISERESPNSNYEKYGKEIKLYLSIGRENTGPGGSQRYVADVVKIDVGNETVYENGNSSKPLKTWYDNGNIAVGWTHFAGEDSKIVVKIKNKKFPDYTFNIKKVDDSGNKLYGAIFSGQMIQQKKNVGFQGNWSDLALVRSGNSFTANNNFKIKSSDLIDVYKINETQTPEGYNSLNKQLVFQVYNDGNKITVIYLFAFDKNASITKEALANAGDNGSNPNFVGAISPGQTKNITIDGYSVKVKIESDGLSVSTSVENKKITGKFRLNIIKLDQDSGKIDLPNNIFNVRRNNDSNYLQNAVIDSDRKYMVHYDDLVIGDNKTETITIEENEAPNSLYYRYTKKIKLTLTRGVLNGKYIVDVSKIEIGTDNNYEVLYYKDDDGNVIVAKPADNKYDNGNVEINWAHETADECIVGVSIKNNRKPDLALKKTIKKINNVKASSKYNENFEGTQNRIISDEWYVPEEYNNANYVNTSTLKNSTNATYAMNKEPISVKRGDLVEYSIKIYNEGSVPARADIIYDYLPLGLELDGVRYNGEHAWLASEADLDESLKPNANYYTLLPSGALKITINRRYNGDYIAPYDSNNNVLSYDEILVTCRVKQDATGILTNVAEIGKYNTETGDYDTDVDSTANNWTTPDGSSKLNDVKSSTAWRNYTTNPADVYWKMIKYWKTTYYAQDAGLNNKKGDDDDFEKVRVIDDYKVQLQKISNEDDTQHLEGIEFYINNKKSSEVSDVSVYKKTTDSQGNTPAIEKDVTYDADIDEEDLFFIKELNVPQTASYTLIDKEFELRVKKEHQSTGGYAISQYSFVQVGERPVYRELSEDTVLSVTDVAGEQVDITVSYDSTNRKFLITIPNNVLSSNYKLQLVKVKDKANETDADIPIKDIKFGINTSQAPQTTNVNGKIDFGSFVINQDNYRNVDTYTITEIEDENSRYFQLLNPIVIKVKKDLNADRTNYVVTGISLDNSEYTATSIEKNVSLKNTTKKVKIKASISGNLITIRVPNIEKEGKYSLNIKKVNGNGSVMTATQAGFSINDSAEVLTSTTDGIAKIITNKTITADSLNADTYVVKETSIGNGYVKLKNPINVVVNKIDNGEKYVVSNVVVSTTGINPVTVQKGATGVLQNVELEDGTKVNITINLQAEDEILIVVPNNEKTGKYNIQLYKYSDNNGVITSVPNLKFVLVKIGVLRASTRITDSNGIADINNIRISETGIDEYDIDEIHSDDSHYIETAEPIRIKVVKEDVNNKYVATDAYFENGSKTTEVLLANGKTVTATINEVANASDGINTIRINVDNPEITGKYSLNLTKIGVKDNSQHKIKDVKFKVLDKETNNEELFTTDNEGTVTIAEKSINYSNVINVDEYVVNEIQINETKYIKLKDPLTIKLEKGKNTYGEEGTVDAVGTKFVVNKITLSGQGLSTTKSTTASILSDSTELTLTGIALKDGSTVDVKASITTEIIPETDERVQRINLTIPNNERTGDYSIRLRKVDTKNNPISNVTFKYNRKVNDVSYISTVTDRTNSSGYISLPSVSIDAEKLNVDDEYTIEELNIYKTANGNEIETGYAKLTSPLILGVKKDIIDNKYDISQIYLSVQGGQPVTSVNDTVTLQNVMLEDGSRVNVTAKIEEDNLITLTVPNKEISGTYSLKLIKTTDNFQTPLPYFTFKYTGNDVGSRTDTNGAISIVDSYVISKDNASNEDTYEITEVENKTNNYLELKDKLTIKVKKVKDDNKYVVDEVKIISGTQIQTISRNDANPSVVLSNIPTVDSNKTTSVKLELNKTTGLITVTADNPEVEGEYTLKLKKVDSSNNSQVLSGVEFKAVKRELSSSYSYQPTKTVQKTTNSNGYAYFAGDDPATQVVEQNEKIETLTDDYWDITEEDTISNYKLLNGVQINVKVPKKLSADGKKRIIDVDNVRVNVERTEYTDEARENMTKLSEGLQTNVSPDGTSIEIIVPNDKLEGNYSLQIVKVEEDGTTRVPDIPFTIRRNNTMLLYNARTNSQGILNIGLPKATEARTDTFEITEEAVEGSKYIGLDESIIVKASVVENSERTMFVLGNVTFADGTTSKEIALKNGNTATATLSVNADNNRITLKVENERIKGKYSLNLRKIDTANNNIENVTFKVNDDTLEPTDANGFVNYFNNKPIDGDSLQDDVYEIKEVYVDTNKYIKINNPIKLTVKKGKSADGKSYKVTGMTLEGKNNDRTIYSTGTTSVTLNNVSVYYGGKVTVRAELDTETDTINVLIPNKDLKGSYSVKIRKVNEEDNSPITGVKFKVEPYVNNETETIITTDETDSDGLTDVKTVQINGAYLNPYYDSFTISEIDIDSSYVKLQSPLRLIVNKQVVDGTLKASSMQLISDAGNRSSTGDDITLEGVRLEDNTTTTVKAKINSSNVITITIPNKIITGKYNIKVAKYDENFEHKLGNAQFKYQINGGAEVTETVNNDTTSDDFGTIKLPEQTITKQNLNTPDVINVTEIKAPTNNYLKLASPITLEVKKTQSGEDYVVDEIVIRNESNWYNLSTYATEAVLNGVTTVNPNITVDVKVTIDRTTQDIALMVENAHLTGTYKLNIKKVDSLNSNHVLSNVTFDVQNPQGNTEQVVTDANGIAYIRGDNPNTAEVEAEQVINNVGRDYWTITETATNAGYQVLSDFDLNLDVQKARLSDGSGYYVKNAYINCVPKTTNEFTERTKAMLAEKTTVEINNAGNEITVTIPNEELKDYSLKLIKVDDSGNPLTGSKFTVEDQNGNKLLDNELLPDGNTFTEAFTNVRSNETYMYRITENESDISHSNILDGFDLLVYIKIDENGDIDENECRIEIEPISSNYSISKYNTIRNYINTNKIKLEKGTGNTAELTIQNPLKTTNYSFELLKTGSKFDETYLPGASFNVLKDNAQLTNFTTNDETPCIIDNVTNIGVNNEFIYEVEETTAPRDYSSNISKARVKVKVNAEGTVSAEITEVWLRNYAVGVTPSWETYDAGLHGDDVSVRMLSVSNRIFLVWKNYATIYNNKYKVRVRKTDTNGSPITVAKIKGNLYRGTNEYNLIDIDGVSYGISEQLDLDDSGDDGDRWVIKELSVDRPYHNIFEDGKELRINVNCVNDTFEYSYDIYQVDGETETLINHTDDIYNYITISLGEEDLGYLIDVQVKNPTDTLFKLVKTNMTGQEIGNALLLVNDKTNQENNHLNYKIEINEEKLSIGTTKRYVISELQAQEPYINVLGNNKLVVTAQLNENNELTIVGKGYIDSNNVEHYNGFGEFDKYVTVNTFVDSRTHIPTVEVKLKNPVKYKLRLRKTNIVRQNIRNANFQLIDENNNVISNNSADYIEYIADNIDSNVKTYRIRELESAPGYKNNLQNKEIIVEIEQAPYTVSVNSMKIKDLTTGEITSSLVSCGYNIIYENQTDDHIPVIDLYMINPTEFDLNVVKKSANGTDYDGAEIELYSYNQMYDTETFIANNIINDVKQTAIGPEKVTAIPNVTYSYVIKEKSTTAPHINILGDNVIRLNATLQADETTGALTLVYDYKIYDVDGNEVDDDYSEFISVNAVKDEETGKYTLNVEILNPVEFIMNFKKTELNGRAINGKTVIEIDGEENTGTASKTITNMKAGDTKVFTITERSVDKPFKNILPGKVYLTTRLTDNETIEVISEEYELDGNRVAIPADVKKYLSYEIVRDENGIENLNITLKNPIEYKIRFVKTEMNSNELAGADFEVEYKDVVYSNEGGNYIEIPIDEQGIGSYEEFKVKEISSKPNYENVFEGKEITVGFRVSPFYKVAYVTQRMTDEDGNTESIPAEYYNVRIDNMTENPDEITAYVFLRNPLKYDFEVVKTDLSGNELSGDDLELKVTRNNDEPVENEGSSKIKYEERNVSANTTNTYVVEELSTIAPHINELKNKKLVVEVKVDGDGNVDVPTFYVKDENNRAVECNYVSFDKDLYSADGTRLIRVTVQNPLEYKFKLTKTDISGNPINVAHLQVNDVNNYDTSTNPATLTSEVAIEKNDARINEVYTYVISESETEAPYVNVLGNRKLEVKARINSRKQLEIVSTARIYENNTREEGLGDLDKYVTLNITKDSETQVETLNVQIKNPIQYKVKLYKVDENGRPLEGTSLRIRDYVEHTNIVNSGASSIEVPVIEEEGTERTFDFTELASALGYNNDLANKEVMLNVKAQNGVISVIQDYYIDKTTTPSTLYNNLDGISEYFSYTVKQASQTTDAIPVIEVTMKNSTDYSLNIVKRTTAGIEYDKAKLELYEINTETSERTLIMNNIVDNVNQANMTLNDIHVLPNKTYTYAIKEVTTTSPHNNILVNKEIRLNVRLEQNETTGALNLVHNYDIYDNEGNRLDNDSSREYITVTPEYNEASGKYTINVDIENPLSVQMKFNKIDLNGNNINGKATMLINGETYTDEVFETYRNCKVGDILTFTIKELDVEKPFVNTLPGTATVKVRIKENEQLEVVETSYEVDGQTVTPIPAEISKYFDWTISTNVNGSPLISFALKNPLEYKVRFNKQDMSGTGLNGANISIRYDGVTYTNDNEDYVEVTVPEQKPGSYKSFVIMENNAKPNYENVLEGKEVIAVIGVGDDYKLNLASVFMFENGHSIAIPSEYARYLSYNVENENELSVTFNLKNPIKYDFEVVKTDLSGNELSGRDLTILVTRNDSVRPVSNYSSSRIKFNENNLLPNTVNTYVVEELSTIAPHVNELENKKLTVQVRVDENGEIVVQKFEVTDKETGEVVATDMVAYDANARSDDGTRLVRVYVRNPMEYKFKLLKTKTKTSEQLYSGEIAETLEGTSIQVGETANVNGSPEINMVIDKVKIGDQKTFIIKENATVGAHINLLENKEIVLTTLMGTDKKVRIVNQQLRDTVTGELTEITEQIKDQYRFDYEIVEGEDGIQTVQVVIENPVKVKLKTVKKDATGITELQGAELELRKGNEIIASNKLTGSSVLEYVWSDVSRDGTYEFTVLENKSVSPNENILKGKKVVVTYKLDENEHINITNVKQKDIATNVEEELSEHVTVSTTEIEGIQTILVEVSNPTGFDIDLVKNAAGVGFLQNTKFKVYREGVETALFDGYVTDINTWNTSEISEHEMMAGRYTYYITETKTARERYINVLENKYIKVNVEVSGKGQVKVMNNNWEEAPNYFEVYEGNIDDRKTTDALVSSSDLIYDDITVGVLVNNETNKYTVQCNVTNPIKYQVELDKVDSVGNSLQGAKFELTSQIVDEQDAEKTETAGAQGVESISEDGVIRGTTNAQGKISYEETFVNVGEYEYTLKEIQTPGNQYVNPFEGYTIHFKVAVNRDGDIDLQFYENGRKCYIEKDGVEAPADIYSYLTLDTRNNLVIAKLHIEVENPVRYKVSLAKDIYGDENIDLSNVKFKIESGLHSSVITERTDANGMITFEETMARPGIYEYWISEIETGNPNILNALKDANIKIYVKVDSDGTIHTVTEDGQIIDGKFYLYDATRQNKIEFENSSIDELIKVSITKENNVSSLLIEVKNPQFYNLNIVKTDIDTNENMNNVTFEVKAYKEVAGGEREQTVIRKADDITKTINTKDLVTATVNSVNGVISFNNILIESAGTYYYEFIENTPKEPIIYKDKAENVVVKVVIGVAEIEGQRQYVIENMEVVQGERYTIIENTEFENKTVNVNITNERVKGKYSLEIQKLDELLGHPLNGATFTVEAVKESSAGTEQSINLYKSTDNVNSMETVIPKTFTIESEDGKFVIPDIRIENLDSYTLIITETEAPETYTVLRDAIKLKVTPKIQGENDDAKFVIDTVELISGENDGLVKIVENDDNERIILEITNNQFDLSLRKFITSINGKDIERWTEPEVDTSKLITGEATTAEYYNGKHPLRIYAGQEIIYTLRVYNEGQIDGYVNKIVDHLPEQLEFLPEDEFNTSRGWKYVEDDETLSSIETDYLSKDNGEEENLIKAFDKETGELDYVEVQVKCKVKENAKVKTYITNIAEITEYEGKDRPDVVDRDSNVANAEIPEGEELEQYKQDEIDGNGGSEVEPGEEPAEEPTDEPERKYIPGQEDDDDFEKVIVEEFDLALRKFITHINEKEITSRVPVFKVDEDGNYVYEHDKTPLIVAHDNKVEYTIRVYNEGTVSGYANLVKDDIPEGLEFVPENETNEKYGWVMLDKYGMKTLNVSEAKYVVTEYLSMENGEAETAEDSEETVENANLIKAFDAETMDEPDYRDLKVVFRVNVPVRRDDVIVNEAQISDDKDDHGDEVEDKDSTPDEWIEDEDDQDREYIKVKYFDLALYKWVTTAMVTENGETTEYETGHTQSDKSNMVNVTIPKNKLDDVTVKFRYTIKVENQGNLPGYAKEVKDHIPAGLKFIAEDNTAYRWVDNGDGTITTDYLKDTLLQEGETAEVEVILTWINGSDNLGQKVNYAEISKDYNYYDSPDVDSTPNNFTGTPVEDDEDGDVVMLNVRTGNTNYQYITIALIGSMTLIAAGIIAIKKYVIRSGELKFSTEAKPLF